jgi:hypothetical protein
MRRFAVVLLAVLGTAAGATAAATAPRAQLRHFYCQRALDPVQRAISVSAVMRPVAHTQSMAIRFELVSRSKPGAPYTVVHGGDLGTWLTPVGQPNLGQRPGDVWSISHPVTDLPAPATYRYHVTFRWTGEQDHVLATRTLTSAKCFQPELRPDLRVVSITIQPISGKPTLNRYIALIRNAGLTGAGPFAVQFAPPAASGAPVKTHTIAALGPHTSKEEIFTGLACTASTAPTVTADPNHQVDDFNRTNNSLTVPAGCPAKTPSS